MPQLLAAIGVEGVSAVVLGDDIKDVAEPAVAKSLDPT